MEAAELASVGVAVPDVELTHGYYRQPNGWITGSPATTLERVQYEKSGWEYLGQYNRFEMASQYAANHPLEQLFMMGGAHELSVNQVVESGLHLNPPLVPACRTLLSQFHKRHNEVCMAGAQPVVFPQLEGLDINYEGYKCNFCPEVKPTEAARDQHEGVAHKDEKSDIRTGEVLGKEIAQGLGAALGNGAAGPADVMGVLKGLKLNKTQRKALRAQGIEIPEDTDGKAEA